MQAVELAGDERDGDFDGVSNELRVGDQTALAVYIAAQPRPTTRQELAGCGCSSRTLTRAEHDAIARGERSFAEIGCATCHVPAAGHQQRRSSASPARTPTSATSASRPARIRSAAASIPATAVTFDLTARPAGQPRRGRTARGALRRLREADRAAGSAHRAPLRRSQAPRHGARGWPRQIDEIGTGASVFLTENLWGVGSTAPYLHDGRATTLTEAILEHGGEAQASRDAFAALCTGGEARRDRLPQQPGALRRRGGGRVSGEAAAGPARPRRPAARPFSRSALAAARSGRAGRVGAGGAAGRGGGGDGAPRGRERPRAGGAGAPRVTPPAPPRARPVGEAGPEQVRR